MNSLSIQFLLLAAYVLAVSFLALGLGEPLTSVEGCIGVTIFFLGLRPIAVWSTNPKGIPPLIELFCLTVAVYYGLPMVFGTNGDFRDWRIAEDVRIEIGLALILATALLNSPNFYRRKSSFLKSAGKELLIPEHRSFLILCSLLAAGITLTLVTNAFGRGVLGAMAGPISTGFAGLSAVSSYVLFRRAGESKLSRNQRFIIIALVLAGVGVQTASAFLAPAIRFLVPAMIGFCVGAGKVPWKATIFIVVLFAFLNLGKGEVRTKHWGGHSQGQAYDVFEAPSRLVDWVATSWSVLTEGGSTSRRTLLTRINLSSVLGVIAEQSPKGLPYLYGETYLSLAYMWIPRALWKDKPIGHADNIKIAIRYGILDAQSAKKTSIGVGLLGEAYVNFGWWGIWGFVFLVGSLLGWVQGLAQHRDSLSLRSFIGATLIVVSISIESALSGTVIPALQSLVVVLTIFAFIVVRRRRSRVKQRQIRLAAP